MNTHRYLVTAALPYSNGPLHVGHIAGAYLPADTYVRYRRARGDDVRFVCGSDDHGVAVLLSARSKAVEPQRLTAHYHERQRRDFEQVGIEFDLYGGTHQEPFAERHKVLSQHFFRRLHARGHLTKRRVTQLYDACAGQFLPDRYVTGSCHHCGHPDAHGGQCEACGNVVEAGRLLSPVSAITGTTPEQRETTHWFLRLRDFAPRLEQWLERKRAPADGSPPWRPSLVNFCLGQIRAGLPERAITRDLEWGIPVPLPDDPDAAGKALYVWFDAPIGYVSFTAALCERLDGDPRRCADWWSSPDCRVAHFIGEDNSVFHGLTWPAMLLGEGSYRLPWQVVSNAFLNTRLPDGREAKISKSRGDAVWVEDLLATLDPDSLRYYLTVIAPESARTTFDSADLIRRNDSELVNVLGNFVHRTLTFAQRTFDGVVPAPGVRGDNDIAQIERVHEQAGRVATHLDAFRFRAGLAEVIALARAGNAYLETRAPWRQRTSDPEGCATSINVCLQTVKALCVISAPFLPFSAQRCADMLRLRDVGSSHDRWSEATNELPRDHSIGDVQPLFRSLGQ